MVIGTQQFDVSGRPTTGVPSPIGLSTDEWESRIGDQIRRARVSAGLDQLQLAELADLSIGAVRNLERGRGSTLKSLVRVARALGLAAWLDGIAPAATISPIDILRGEKRPRERVYRARTSPAASPES